MKATPLATHRGMPVRIEPEATQIVLDRTYQIAVRELAKDFEQRAKAFIGKPVKFEVWYKIEVIE